MELVRLKNPDDPRYSEAMRLYGLSFPHHEQREAASQRAILTHEDYHFWLILEEERLLGILLCWEAEAFVYVEHFCMSPEVRGRGYGSRALKLVGALAKERGRCVILEIDPPVDEVSLRRKGFYERAGYRANPWTHVHPPYHAGAQGHALVVMSYPAELSQEEYEGFRDYLSGTVMAAAY